MVATTAEAGAGGSGEAAEHGDEQLDCVLVAEAVTTDE
jgi:hypothetical protein